MWPGFLTLQHTATLRWSGLGWPSVALKTKLRKQAAISAYSLTVTILYTPYSKGAVHLKRQLHELEANAAAAGMYPPHQASDTQLKIATKNAKQSRFYGAKHKSL